MAISVEKVIHNLHFDRLFLDKIEAAEKTSGTHRQASVAEQTTYQTHKKRWTRCQSPEKSQTGQLAGYF